MAGECQARSWLASSDGPILGVPIIPRNLCLLPNVFSTHEDLLPILKVFNHLLALVRSVDAAKVEAFRQARDYEALELYILEHLMAR